MSLLQQTYRLDLQVAVLQVSHLLQLLAGVHALRLAGQNIPRKSTLEKCPRSRHIYAKVLGKLHILVVPVHTSHSWVHEIMIQSRTFSPPLGGDDTLKCCSDNFKTHNICHHVWKNAKIINQCIVVLQLHGEGPKK